MQEENKTLKEEVKTLKEELDTTKKGEEDVYSAFCHWTIHSVIQLYGNLEAAVCVAVELSQSSEYITSEHADAIHIQYI